jgi:hypothetical protein
MSEPKELSLEELRAIEEMPADEYRQKLSDPEFRARVNRVPVAPVVLDGPPAEELPAVVEPVAPVVEAVEPVAPVEPPALVELPEQRYEYQPTDDIGRPMGGKQVIKYKTQDELATKLVEQNVLLQRKLREVSRKQQLGITDEVKPSADAEFQDVMELKPRELTADERFTLSQDLQDPAKSVEAVNTLFEAAIGLSPTKLREQFNKQQIQTLTVMARQNYDIFEAAKKDSFYPCQENKQLLTDWMVKKGLNPTVANFELALSHLSGCGLLADRPIVREAIPPVPAPVVETKVTESVAPAPVAAESRITPPAQPQARQARVPSGLNNSNSSDGSPNMPSVTLSSSDIAKMSADEYKIKLRDPQFRKLVDELDRQAAAKRATRSNA